MPESLKVSPFYEFLRVEVGPCPPVLHHFPRRSANSKMNGVIARSPTVCEAVKWEFMIIARSLECGELVSECDRASEMR